MLVADNPIHSWKVKKVVSFLTKSHRVWTLVTIHWKLSVICKTAFRNPVNKNVFAEIKYKSNFIFKGGIFNNISSTVSIKTVNGD